MTDSPPGPRVTEPQLRSVLLAQAIVHADAECVLVSEPERDEAVRSAVAAARQRGAARVDVADIALDWAQAVVRRAGGRDGAVAALAQPNVRLRWLARGLPVAALLLGLAVDRIANAHRVDLLSPPLLLVLAWNLAMYLLLAWRAWSGAGQPELAPALRRWARHVPGGRRGLAARIAAHFHAQWFARTTGLFAQRAARVLHLCAAAWGAGIALSLLARGLVVRYQFGWESTFLDAAQVHAIVAVLFWPLTAVFGLAPFTLAEIAATQNFAGQGAAGSRWVWMYVGLLVLVVVLPRLLLAAWARWREARLAGQCRIDPGDAAFDALRAALPGDLVLGLQGASAAQARALHAIVAAHADTGLDDRLRFTDAGVAEPVDAVIALAPAGEGDRLPSAWQGAPVLALPWSHWAESWLLESVLFDRLAPLLPHQPRALQRLRQAWVWRNEERFEQSLQALARHLRACAALGEGDAAAYAQHLQALDAALCALHGQPLPPGPAVAPGDAAPPRARPASGTALAVGTSAGAAAGAAAGAKAGALIDLGLGGVTLGAGTALGGLLGATAAWVLRAQQHRNAADEVLRRAAEAACTHYLVIAHQARVPPPQATRLAERWHAEVMGTVAAHWDRLEPALRSGAAAPADALQAQLRTMLLGVLRRSLPAAGD